MTLMTAFVELTISYLKVESEAGVLDCGPSSRRKVHYNYSRRGLGPMWTTGENAVEKEEQ